MDYSYTPDQELFIESAKEFAEKYFDDEAVKKAYEKDHHISLEAAMAYRELGFMHLGLPEEVGGIPCSKLTQIILTEKLHEFTGTALPFTTDTNSITRTLIQLLTSLILDPKTNRSLLWMQSRISKVPV